MHRTKGKKTPTSQNGESGKRETEKRETNALICNSFYFFQECPHLHITSVFTRDRVLLPVSIVVCGSRLQVLFSITSWSRNHRYIRSINCPQPVLATGRGKKKVRKKRKTSSQRPGTRTRQLESPGRKKNRMTPASFYKTFVTRIPETHAIARSSCRGILLTC